MDGDQIFIVLEKKGKPIYHYTNLTRAPGAISEEEVNMLFSKASRTNRTDIKTWLPTYFDDVPIGPATYAIRWMLYNALKKYKGTSHPMSEAWNEVAPKAIKMIEFVMDIRKGDWTDKEISQKMAEIQSKMKEIKSAQNQENWFAKTVTSASIKDIRSFIKSFDSLQDYVNLITMQPTSLTGEFNG